MPTAQLDNPLNRLRSYLSAPSRKWWDATKEEELKAAKHGASGADDGLLGI